MKALDRYIEAWHRGPVVSLRFDSCASYATTYNVESAINFAFFCGEKGTTYAILPTSTAILDALGNPWETSLERQVALAEWGEQQGLLYLGERPLHGTRKEAKPYREYNNGRWLPDLFPRVTYLGIKTEEGEVLVPAKNIIKDFEEQ